MRALLNSRSFSFTSLTPASPEPASLAPIGLAGATVLALVALGTPALQAPADAAKAKNPTATVITERSFDTDAQLRTGKVSGATVHDGSVKLKAPRTVRRIAGQKYKAGAWTSPWVSTQTFDEVIPSWQASTPGHSLIEVKVRVRNAAGRAGSWDTVARWTSQAKGTVAGKPVYARKSWTKQSDDLASVLTDTVRTNSAAGATAYQVKVVLMRRAGTTTRPVLHRVGAVASRVVQRTTTSAPGAVAKAGTVLDVPRYSQMVHAGHYPQWGNGGEAWCSPTSLAMVLEFHGANPAAGHAFTPTLNGRKHADGIVDHTARATYDHAYKGTGNWGFNTAYAGTLLPKTRVSRLADLRAAESFIKAGKPLIVSVAFNRGELTGAPISSTAGHLMVLVGFTAGGDVVVNDPAAKNNAGVRRTYDRAQFERAWLTRSGGLTYVLER